MMRPDLFIKRIIHIEPYIDLILSENPNPDFKGWRFWDYMNKRISNPFDDQITARNELINNKVIWREFAISKN